MSEDVEIFKDLMNSFKQDMTKELEKVATQIEKLNDKIDDFNEKSNKISITIGVIQEKQSTLKQDLQNNFDQHKDFYDRLGDLEKRKIPDVTILDAKAESNENEIIKLKTQNKTAYTAFSIVIIILGILSKLGII